MKIFIKPINKNLILNEVINNIYIENIELYRLLYYNLCDEIILSENNIELDINKNIYIIKNVNEIIINEKKTINLLYKYIENINRDSIKDYILNVKNDIIELLDMILDNSEFSLEYNTDFELTKLLGLTDLQFKLSNFDNYIQYIIESLKVISYFSKIKIFLTYGLMNYFCEEEIIKLKKELSLLNIIIINFEINKNTNYVSYIIDGDYCVL